MVGISPSTLRRAASLVAVLDLAGVTALAKEHGFTDHSFVKRLQYNLVNQASIADAPGKGRHAIYTAGVLDACLEIFKKLDRPVWSREAFVSEMIDQYLLPVGTSVGGFWAAFQKHLKKRGWHLAYGPRRTMFALSNKHCQGRLKWAKDNETVLTNQTVGDYWFCDEISIEQGGKPKGEVHGSCPYVAIATCPHAQQQSAG